jgi:hypothetical protein
LWGFVKDKVYFPSLTANVDDLQVRITGTVAEVTPDVLHYTWKEIHYMWDTCHATSESNIEM